MKLISHRGNISGKAHNVENRPVYIESALKLGYDVEVDVWVIGDQFWLGHDRPEYPISLHWIQRHHARLWVHCKNLEAVQALLKEDVDEWKSGVNYFWHETDTLSITSAGYIWTTDVSITGPNVVWMIVNDGPMNDIGNPEIYGICADDVASFGDLTDS